MEDFGYWIFLLILYLLSAIMKKRKQKAAYTKMEEVEKVEEANDWKAPEFIKGLFSDFAESEDVKEEEILTPVIDTVDYKDEIDTSLEYESEVPLEKIHLTHKDLSSIRDRRQVGTIKHKLLGKETIKTTFFKKQQDVKMAVIYKEILDKPRALRKRIR